MNLLGIAFVWLAAQVTLLLLAAVGLHWIASRRGAAAGAWVASISLAFVLLLSALAVMPWSLFKRNWSQRVTSASVGSERYSPEREETRSHPIDGSPTDRAFASGWLFRSVIAGWRKIGRSTTEQIDRVPSLTVGLAYLVVAGAVIGLLRLCVGIWAIARLRRRAQAIDDVNLQALLAELTAELRCRCRVALVQTSDLSAPATAGWLHPVILLPEDWHTWTNQDRRAVFAHELTHIQRHDYAWTLLAQLAAGLHFYHPLVHWLAVRLKWQQELAADAQAARLAGGTELYVLTLSKLALQRDAKTPNWTARAFLPARGTFIRRIEMLRTLDDMRDRSWSWPRRSLAVVVLSGLTLGLSTFRGPAWGESPGKVDAGVSVVKALGAPQERPGLEPFDFSFLPENLQGIAAIRPAEIFRRADMAGYRTAINLFLGTQWAAAAKAFGFDPTKPGQKPFRIEMIEQVSGPCEWGPLTFKWGGFIRIKTTESVDWLQLARIWKRDPVEKHDGGHVYYMMKESMPGQNSHMYCPDDQTVLLGSESNILEYLRRSGPSKAPVFAGQTDWESLQRGLALIAINNRDRKFAKLLLGEPDERKTPTEKPDESVAQIALIVERTDLMTIGLSPGGAPTLEVSALCADARSSEATLNAVRSLLESARKAVSQALATKDAEVSKVEEDFGVMLVQKLDDANITREGIRVLLRSERLGNVADLARLVSTMR